MSKAGTTWTRDQAAEFVRRTGNKTIAEALHMPAKRSTSPVVPSEAPGRVNVPDKGFKGKKRREMNQTERSFSHLLDRQVDRGEIISWEYESIMFRWGEHDTLKYSPDFTVEVAQKDDGRFPLIRLRFIETFGSFKRPGDLRRFKEARNKFTRLEFQLWSKTNEGWKQLL